MKKKDVKFFRARKVWRKRLEENHQEKKKVWLKYYKKHTKKITIAYDDAVEEAICFGWIDGKVKSIDDECYIDIIASICCML